MDLDKVIYLDNNATTIDMAKSVRDKLEKYLLTLNPATDSVKLDALKKQIEKAKLDIHKHCGTTPETYYLIFTSGASESNGTILRSVANAYKVNTGKVGHIISSAVEHNSILQCLEDMKREGATTYSLVQPNIYGTVNVGDVEKEVKTCLGRGVGISMITIMGANNETGSINNIRELADMAFKYKIPFHSDLVQAFGKFKISLPENHITAISASMHKLYGPRKTGILMINRQLVEGYKLSGLIPGSQQFGFRGGTEDPASILATAQCIYETFKDRDKKNEKLRAFRSYIISEFGKRYPIARYESFLQEEKKHALIELVILGPEDPMRVLPNTILLSVTKNKGEMFCNVKFKKELDKENIIVSIGSACNTSNPKASHVLYAISAPQIIKKGVIRISLGDYNTKPEIDQFIKKFLHILDRFIITLDTPAKEKRSGISQLGFSEK